MKRTINCIVNILKIKVTHEKKTAKRNHFENLFSKENGNTFETWNAISKLLQKPKRKTTAMPQSTEIGKQLIKCPESICNTMNERFVTIGEKIWANLKRTTEQGFKKFLGERPISSIVIRPTDEHEIIGILAGVSNNKSTV